MEEKKKDYFGTRKTPKKEELEDFEPVPKITLGETSNLEYIVSMLLFILVALTFPIVGYILFSICGE